MKSAKVFLSIFLILLLADCSPTEISESEAAKQTQARAVELDLYVQYTLQAQSEREQSIQQTLLASTSPNISETPIPADETTPTIQPPTAAPASTPSIEPSEAPESIQKNNEQDFQEWMQSAKILVYEDMTARLETFRYVLTTLEAMDLPYKDDGSAIGWFYDDIESGPEEGGQWDLIIIATEDKKGVKANFYDIALDAADNGTSTILEVWNLNNTYSSTANNFLTKCGVIFEKDMAGIPPSSALLFPIAREHPILNQPNTGMTFSSPIDQWWDPSGKIVYDVGDLIGLSTTGDATLLLGTGVASDITHGIAAVCDQGKITLQTFSSHIMSYKSMALLWENYIYNALRTRYESEN